MGKRSHKFDGMTFESLLERHRDRHKKGLCKHNFSKSSLKRIEELKLPLQYLMFELIERVDFTVTCGYRSPEEQDRLYNTIRNGKRVTYAKGGQSKHNTWPSSAVDIVQYIRGKGVSFEVKQAYYLAGMTYMLVMELELTDIIRIGSDWDMDYDVNDQKLFDPYHIEIYNDDWE